MAFTDKEKQKVYLKAYRLAHKDEIKAYRLAHKEDAKAYRKSHKEKQKTYAKKYRDTHTEQEAKRRKLYRVTNKDKVNSYQRRYIGDNKAKAKEWAKKSRSAHPEQERDRKKKRRALMMGVCREIYTDISIFERDGWICGICGKKINGRLRNPHPFSKSIDHVIPLSKGGIDAPINLQASHFRCNIRKHTKSGGQLRLMA